MTITATFAPGTNPDIAQVQVQNKVTQATTRLPQEVQQQGLTVAKSQTSFLLVVALYDDTGGRYTNVDISDFLASKLQDPLSRVPGVGNIQVFGSPYAMRIWLDPYKLQTFNLTPGDVRIAIQAQNTQVSAGELGGLPSTKGQQLDATVTAQSRLTTPEQFRNIVLKSATGGAIVKLGDVARVEIGADSYQVLSRMNGKPAAGIAIQLAPGANALTTADAVKAKAQSLAASFPPGVKLGFPVDNTTFIRLSINEVIKTLVEAIILVIVVMFVFLQNWRTTLIPAIAVPVVLLGTFGVLSAAGLFDQHAHACSRSCFPSACWSTTPSWWWKTSSASCARKGLRPRKPPRNRWVRSPARLIGIALVLSAVFLPMAFFGGSTGVIYRQFSVTIVSAMVLSILVALILTPALCATLLKPIPQNTEHSHGRFFTWFNRSFEATRDKYHATVEKLFGMIRPAMIVYGVIVLVMIPLFIRLPSAFLPEEDQGAILAQFTLPAGAMQSRTLEVAKQIEHHWMVDEKDNVDVAFIVAGFSFAGPGQNSGISFVHLKNWEDRPDSAPTIARNAMMALFQNSRCTGVRACAASGAGTRHCIGLRCRTGRPRQSRP